METTEVVQVLVGVGLAVTEARTRSHRSPHGGPAIGHLASAVLGGA
ncbi:hypothetical protein QFZ55_002947 [Streptomyces luteogriseus]|nr:hypothetical protein [Streptomyces luteogriseus]MDQ0713495.1 hypothetical protein [Streptomyces luteogriseus]